LSPQPQPTDVVKAHRHYAMLQADDNYRKRVTWFFNLPGGDKKAVLEYQGIHPGTSLPHGNAKHTKSVHIYPAVTIIACIANKKCILAVQPVLPAANSMAKFRFKRQYLDYTERLHSFYIAVGQLYSPGSCQ